MDEQPQDDDEGWRVLPLPPRSGWRDFWAQHVELINDLGCQFFFAGALCFAIGAWSFGADMTMAASALFFAWLFGGVGLWLTSRISAPAKVFWATVFLVGCVAQAGAIYTHFHTSAAQQQPIASNQCDVSPNAPGWLQIAAKECGQKELRWPEENLRINDYFASLKDGKHHRQDIEDRSSDWASPFVEWVMDQVQKPGPRSIDPLAWLKWGKAAENPENGSIVVLRNNGIPHVGFYYRDDGDRIDVLGGNQDDQVKISDYPKSAVLGYRVPADN